jgi:hypothetical protein
MTKPLPSDDADIEAMIEDALDADDATTYRMWRHRVLGNTPGAIIGMAAADKRPRRNINLSVPTADYEVLARIARSRGVSVSILIRQALATLAVESHGVPRSSIPFLARDGLLT